MRQQVIRDGRVGRRLVPLKGIICRPGKGQVYDPARFMDGLQGLQRGAQDSRLSFCIAGRAQDRPKGMFNCCQPRHADRGAQRPEIGKYDRADAGGFDLALHQSNGPVADGSGGDQDKRIHLIFLQAVDNLRHGLVE